MKQAKIYGVEKIMKILITTDLFTVDANGVVTSVRNLFDELKNKGHDVRILTLSDKMHSHKDGAVYYIRSVPIGVYPNVRMPLSYHHKLIRELLDWKPDIIHSQCEFFSFQYALRISKITGAPLVHTYHTLYEQYVTYVIPNKRIGKYLVRILSKKRLKKAKIVIAPTDKVEKVLKDYGISSPIRVVPSGLSLAQHQSRMSDDERRRKRAALGIPDDHNVVLNLGRLGTEKNLNELLELFAKLLSVNDHLTFLVVGDGPAKAELQKLSDKLRISEHVLFTGMVSPSEVQNYYQIGDVFVSASTSETQGLTYIEAAANGLPLLCRKDPCLNGVIQEGVNGYMYTTADEFLSDIDIILRDSDWRTTAGQYSEKIAASFDKSRFATGIENIYKSVIS